MQLVSDCLDSVRASLSALDDKGIEQVLRDIEMLSRKAQSVMLEVVAETDGRGIAARAGFGSTARLVAAMLRLSGADARMRVEHAELVGTRRALGGEVLAPRAPATAAGVAAGEIGLGQLRVIAETMAALPTSIPEPVREQVEADLAGYARDFDPRRLRTIAHRIVATVDPDGPEPEPADPTPEVPVRGELWLRNRRDGRLGLEGWLDPEHGAMLRSLIEQLAAPRRAVESVPDPRTTPQRHADALVELAERVRSSDDFPTAGGEPPHLTVTLDWEALRTGVGAATLDHGQLISAADARRMACDCQLIPVVLDGESEPLDVGRAMRTVPRGIRRALVARDRGCAFPGCHRPPQFCAAHHVRHWADGGVTSVETCCLLCPMHHQQIHLQGWDVTIQGGRVEFRPPAVMTRTGNPSPTPSGGDHTWPRPPACGRSLGLLGVCRVPE